MPDRIELPPGYLAAVGELTTDQIVDAMAAILNSAKEICGETITPESVDLRLWAAAMLVHSVFEVSIESVVRASLDVKLSILSREAKP